MTRRGLVMEELRKREASRQMGASVTQEVINIYFTQFNGGLIMEVDCKEITINGISYVPKTHNEKMAVPVDGMKYVIVRTYLAGVFAGYLESRTGQEVIMRNARRLWYWSGAASLSQLAMEGVKNPTQCKFPCPVDRVELLQAIEILDCTEVAKNSIGEVPVWKK